MASEAEPAGAELFQTATSWRSYCESFNTAYQETFPTGNCLAVTHTAGEHTQDTLGWAVDTRFQILDPSLNSIMQLCLLIGFNVAGILSATKCSFIHRIIYQQHKEEFRGWSPTWTKETTNRKPISNTMSSIKMLTQIFGRASKKSELQSHRLTE